MDRKTVGVDAWVLCAEFVDRILSEATDAARRRHPDGKVPHVDVEAIWRAGDGAPSDELSIGRIVRAASDAAAALAGDLRGVAAPKSPDAIDRPVTPAPLPPPAATALPAPPAPPLPPAPTRAAPQPAVPREEPVTSIVASVTAPVAPAEEHTPVRVQPLPEEDAVAATAIDLVVPEPGMETEAEAGTEAAGPSESEKARPTRRIFRNRSAWLTTFTWIEIIGAFIILFVGWQLWGTAIAQAHDQSELKTQFENGLKEHRAPTAAAAAGQLIPASTRFGTPADGSVVAEIQIPAIGVDQYVVSGTNESDLSKGPGHYNGTALPGQAGNVGIAGHRTTNGAPFNRLGELKAGDKIILTTTWGEHLTYVVSGTPVAVSPNDVAVLNYFGDNRITLTTCTPEYSAAQRLVAVGELQGHKTTALPPAGHVHYDLVDAGTASWNWALLPAVGLELSLLVLLGLSYRRIGTWFGRHAKWFVLVPVWAAGLYLLFQTLTTFLPDTL